MGKEKLNFKALISEATFASSGLLNPKQASVFVDNTVDEQVILKEADVRKMTSNEEELNSLSLGSRQIRKHSAGVKGTSSAIASATRTLKLTEGKIWFELDMRTLRRLTIEGDGKDVQGKLLAHIMKMAAVQYGNDIEDLGLNGDIADAGVDAAFLNTTDGWIKKIKADGITYDINLSVDYKANFGGMLAALPEKYKKNPAKLRFYVTTTARDGYIDQIAGQNSSASLAYLTGEIPPKFKGIPVVGVPSMPAAHSILTNPKNLAFGIDTTGIERDFGKKVVERVIETVVVASIGYEISNGQAVVIGYSI